MKTDNSQNRKQLKSGITTGTCAAAAARACAIHLLLGVKTVEKVTVMTPKGIAVEVPVFLEVENPNGCTYKVIKDSGDDPDVTNGIAIFVTLRHMHIPKNCANRAGNQDELTEVKNNGFYSDRYDNLYLTGGEGIGIVRKQGLEQQIGQPAINAVPRQMLFDAVGSLCEQVDYQKALEIVVSIPAGVELAKRTFNPKLGIEGGISVLGTSGIVEPMSEQAIVDTIEVFIRQQSRMGNRNLLVAPGNYGQTYIERYLKLSMEDSIKCSNYIGETIDLAIAYQMQSFLLVGNIGKLMKLAAGIMNTHSKVADARCEIMALHTLLSGGTKQMAQTIMACSHTDEMLKYLEEWGLREDVMKSLCDKIEYYMERRIGDRMEFGVMLFSGKYGFLGATDRASDLVDRWEKG